MRVGPWTSCAISPGLRSVLVASKWTTGCEKAWASLVVAQPTPLEDAVGYTDAANIKQHLTHFEETGCLQLSYRPSGRVTSTSSNTYARRSLLFHSVRRVAGNIKQHLRHLNRRDGLHTHLIRRRHPPRPKRPSQVRWRSKPGKFLNALPTLAKCVRLIAWLGYTACANSIIVKRLFGSA